MSARINSFTILWAERYTGPGKLFVRIQPLILMFSFFLSLPHSTNGLRSVTEFRSCKELLQLVKVGLQLDFDPSNDRTLALGDLLGVPQSLPPV